MSAHSSRVVSIQGVMRIKDDELGGDDYFNRSRDFPSMVLGVNGIMANTYDWVERAGGEIRIEVLVTAMLNPSNGVVTITHNTMLFEGTSTKTGDLDGTGNGSVQVPRGGQQVINYTVNNTNEGGDWVKVSLTCTNSRIAGIVQSVTE
jgi:hypothetical protein